MKSNILLTVAIAIIFDFLSLGLTLPTGNDALNVLEPRLGYDYVLVCPPRASKTVAAECWRRFRTTCNDNGYMSNEFNGNGNICNRNVCYCARDSSVPLPGFAESAPLYGTGSHRLIEEGNTPAGKLDTGSVAVRSVDDAAAKELVAQGKNDVNSLERRDGYTLFCPSGVSNHAASDCTASFNTHCDDNGLFVNEVASTGAYNDCNSQACFCYPNSAASILEEPSESVNIAWETSVVNSGGATRVSTEINTGTILPDRRDVVTREPAARRDTENTLEARGYYYILQCFGTSGYDCGKKYQTDCDDAGYIKNPYVGDDGKECNYLTCHCIHNPVQKFSYVSLP